MNWHTEVAGEFARLHKSPDASVIEELAQHAAAAYEAARADGVPATEAEARIRALIVSWCANTTGPQCIQRTPLRGSAPSRPPSPGGFGAASSWFSGLGLDVRLSLRLLWRQAGFSAISIAMIALGIAATTSIFSVVNGIVLKPLAMPGAEGLVRVMEVGALKSGATDISNLTYTTWAESPATIEEIGAWSPEHIVDINGPNGVIQEPYSMVTPSLFPLLRAAPFIGRDFSERAAAPDDDGAPRERRRPTDVILSYGFWQERFGGASDVLGKKIDLEPWPRSTIIGVMPQGFEWPSRATRLWVPAPFDGPVVTHPVGKRGKMTLFTVGFMNAVARLKPGFTAEQAAAEATGRVNAPGGDFAQARSHLFGGDGAVRIKVVPLLEWSLQDVQPALWMLLGAVGLLFAAAVGNVVNLLLARAAKRQQEVAVRAAIGAGGARLARQLFVETLPIALVGGALGFGITVALLRVLPTLLPENFPRVQEIGLDGRVLGVAVGLTFLASLLTGLLPARLARHLRLTAVLADAGGATGLGPRATGARSGALIIASQVAVAALLLVGAALLGQSFLRMVTVDRGYELANVLTARALYNPLKPTHGVFRPFYDRVLSHLTSMPGVTHAGMASHLPLTPARRSVEVSERTARDRKMYAQSRMVSPDYFAAMGIRVRRGRGFTRDDVYGSEQVMLVNETFASRYLTSDPLGVVLHAPFHSVGSTYGPDSLFRVVGVVADVKDQGPADPVEPEIYATYNQFGKPGEGPGESQYLAVRTTGNPAALAKDLEQFVSSLSPWASLEQVMTMETRVQRTLARPRLYATLVGGFAAFAVIVALMGLFGGLSYMVTQRTREIGVRTALGATPRHIMSLVLKQGGAMTVIGLLLGLGAAAAMGRYLATYLFGIEPLDIQTFVIVAGGLLVLALVASAIPARRAARIDPITALRH